VHYRVTAAGCTVRLYSNGVFHSQFNPSNVFSGALWDCLSLPALLHRGVSAPRSLTPLRILVLGVGGGAVLKQLRVLYSEPQITGIDLDSVHLSVAKRWFRVNHKHDRLIHADAVAWVTANSKRKFDIIVDDLFTEQEHQPIRAVAMNYKWSTALTKLLAPGGMLIANFVERREFKQSYLNRLGVYPSVMSLQHPLYENCIGVYHTQSRSAKHWREAIGTHPALSNRQRQLAGKLVLRQHSSQCA